MLKFEFKSMFFDRKNVYFFIIILAISLYFVNSGIRGFRQFQEEKAETLDVERKMVESYDTWIQYSGFGFRMFFDPSPLVIFFNNSTVLSDIEGKIDNTGVLTIHNRFKGKKLFYNRGYFKDFSGFIYFTGSLLMLYMGIVGFRSLNRLKFELQFVSLKKLFLLSTLSRLFYLNLYFVVVMALAFGYAGLEGFSFLGGEISHLLAYTLFTVIMLNFYYFIGLLLSIILKFKQSTFLWMFILWVFFIFLAPEVNRLFLYEDIKGLPSNAKIDLQKRELLMEFEKKVGVGYLAVKDKTDEEQTKYKLKAIEEFMTHTHELNKIIEDRQKKEIEKVIFKYEKRSLLFPYLYYFFLSSEISSKGHYGYLEFKDHMVKIQEQFLRFYFTKSFIERKKVEDFVKKDENIFKGRSHLTKTFLWACTVTFYYCLVLALAAFILLKRQVYPND
ncbi:MAG: hypothetical protein GY940_09570 [bacterium]|nr:hypothetical protein [bacterium]